MQYIYIYIFFFFLIKDGGDTTQNINGGDTTQNIPRETTQNINIHKCLHL